MRGCLGCCAMLAAAAALSVGTGFSAPSDKIVEVHNTRELRQAVGAAGPGTRIVVSAGEYSGGLAFGNLRGEEGRPIVIEGADPSQPPVLRGGSGGIHLTDPAYVELRNLAIMDAAANGLNLDDGGSYETSAHHIVLSGLRIENIGRSGNQDAIKLSGVDDFRVENCRIERWGTGGGSAVDMVGCHRGVISGCLFRHTDVQGSTGVQAKGGTRQIVIRGNRFENAGYRAVNIGGSTGLRYFRPPLKSAAGEPPQHCEAAEICVEGNVFLGGGTAVAFVGCDGSVVRFNTIYRPKFWVMRILQETRESGFVPSRNGEFTDNVIAFRADELREVVNIGSATAPQTFRFARNVWYCLDNPARSRPSLPSAEEGGVYGRDPMFRDPERGDLNLQPGSPAAKAGAAALPSRPPS